MAQRLDEPGVDVTELIWPAPHEPQLPHECQFHLDMPEAQEALAAAIDRLTETTTRRGVGAVSAPRRFIRHLRTCRSPLSYTG